MAGRERDDGGFLSRWSERKSEARQTQDEAQGDVVEQAARESGAPADATAETAAETEAFNPDDLPDIETLDKDSDFSVFMHSKVPEALRRRALRRLWRVDPTFAFLDGMNDYDEDYTDAAMVVEGLKTAYQVGKGMISPDEPAEDELEKDEAEKETADEAGTLKEKDEDAEEPAAAEAEGAVKPDEESDVAEQPQQALEDRPQTDGLAGRQPLPQASEEAESALAAPAAKPVSKPSGSALRRRWGDQTG